VGGWAVILGEGRGGGRGASSTGGERGGGSQTPTPRLIQRRPRPHPPPEPPRSLRCEAREAGPSTRGQEPLRGAAAAIVPPTGDCQRVHPLWMRVVPKGNVGSHAAEPTAGAYGCELRPRRLVPSAILARLDPCPLQRQAETVATQGRRGIELLGPRGGDAGGGVLVHRPEGTGAGLGHGLGAAAARLRQGFDGGEEAEPSTAALPAVPALGRVFGGGGVSSAAAEEALRRRKHCARLTCRRQASSDRSHFPDRLTSCPQARHHCSGTC